MSHVFRHDSKCFYWTWPSIGKKVERFLLISLSFGSEPRWLYYPLFCCLFLLKDVSIVWWKTKTVNKIVITFVKYLILKQVTAAVLLWIFSFTVLWCPRKTIHVRKQIWKRQRWTFWNAKVNIIFETYSLLKRKINMNNT